MDTRSSSFGCPYPLHGVAKTLRKLYAPPQEPSRAIEQALAALVFLEAQRARAARKDLVLAAVA